jgi:hypothetical protein
MSELLDCWETPEWPFKELDGISSSPNFGCSLLIFDRRCV